MVQNLIVAVLLSHVGVELLLVGLRHHVPCFCGAGVAVVDGVEQKVLHVPAERREEHAHVDPGDGDPTDGLVSLLSHSGDAGGRLVEVVQIKIIRRIVKMVIRILN